MRPRPQAAPLSLSIVLTTRQSNEYARDLWRPLAASIHPGVQPPMYRGCFLTIRQDAGRGTAGRRTAAFSSPEWKADGSERVYSTCRPRWGPTYSLRARGEVGHVAL